MLAETITPWLAGYRRRIRRHARIQFRANRDQLLTPQLREQYL
jgi:hypothetical protein